MDILVNDEPRAVAARTLAALVEELGLTEARIATALDGTFVPATARARTEISAGARVEIVAPMQGG